MNPAVSPIKDSTQAFLEIREIKDGLVMLRDGSCVLVIATTATNFGLLSEKEQDAVIYAYGALLNSLNFPIQILIRSKRKDISSYMTLLEQQESRASNKKLKERIREYREFIQNTVQVNNVLEKDFYIVIPMSFLEIGLTKTIGSAFKKSKELPYPKEYILDKAKTNLYPKRDHLFRLLSRLGLRPRQLNTQELVQLFFEIYNPEVQGQTLGSTEEYQAPMVKTAVSFGQLSSSAQAAPPTAKAAPASPPQNQTGSQEAKPTNQAVSDQSPPSTKPALSTAPPPSPPKATAPQPTPVKTPPVTAETEIKVSPEEKKALTSEDVAPTQEEIDKLVSQAVVPKNKQPTQPTPPTPATTPVFEAKKPLEKD